MKMKVLDYDVLLKLNHSSIQAGRSHNLSPRHLSEKPRERYWVNEHGARERNGQQEVRICIVLNLYAGRTAWLDVSAAEFDAIPETDISDLEWEAAMCAGTPPPAP